MLFIFKWGSNLHVSKEFAQVFQHCPVTNSWRVKTENITTSNGSISTEVTRRPWWTDIKVHHGEFLERGHRDLNNTEKRRKTKTMTTYTAVKHHNKRCGGKKKHWEKKIEHVELEHTCPLAAQFVFNIIRFMSKKFNDFILMLLDNCFTLEKWVIIND